jgi:uncharacterized protein YjbJ (UPF0337 family)
MRTKATQGKEKIGAKMDWSTIEQNWNLFQQRVKEKWEKLSEEDLNAINGRRDQLEEKIQTRYGFASDYVHKEVDDWLRWQNSSRLSASRHAL